MYYALHTLTIRIAHFTLRTAHNFRHCELHKQN